MGVDFYPCSDCGETFPDCGDYASCEDCGEMLCPRCMGKYDVRHAIRSQETIDESAEEDNEFDLCPFCAKAAVSDSALLEYALQKLDMSKEALVEMYKAVSN